MREILFRGKSIKDKKWVYGFVDNTTVCGASGNYIATIINEKAEKPFVGEWYEIDPETVGQYTGLNDKNGNKIFEGDICKFESDIEEFTNYEILWHVNKWVALACEENIADVLDLFFCDRSVVIGNIHDNPEFLEA